MNHRLGLSGSTILSDTHQFSFLFERGLDHVEIGEFPDETSYETFKEMAEDHQLNSFGIHSPLLRGRSKYDLIERVAVDPEEARHSFEREVARLAEERASYVLVHFPYFAGTSTSPFQKIEEGLKFLHRLKETYALPIVCEPKLGRNRSGKGIDYLRQFPVELWERYGLDICVDLGDYRMAAAEDWRSYVEPLLPFTSVVHLHNVSYVEDKYYWIPIHPDKGRWNGAYDMEPMLQMLGEGREKYFIFEHTPHMNPTSEEVDEGIRWVRDVFSRV